MGDPIVGSEVNGYRINEVLGRGGMGVVYKAEDLALQRPVAVKRLNPQLAGDESFLSRFRSEAQAIARVNSPYIVQIFTLSETDIGLIIVMEYVEGRTLKQRIVAGETGWRESLPLMQQMLTALWHAHDAGVVHRDIKPQNILLSDIVRAHAVRAKMTDFGLAKTNTSGDPSRTVTEGVYGTLRYMSPEQVEGYGETDRRSDIYSLGMTFYEMLSGRLPFDEESTEYTIMRTIVEADLPELGTFAPEVPDDLRDIVMTALAKAPGDRFQSAKEMQNALREFEPSSEQESRERESATIPAGPEPPPEDLLAQDTSGKEKSSGEGSSSQAEPAASHFLSFPMGWRVVGVGAVLAIVLVGVWYLAVGPSTPSAEPEQAAVLEEATPQESGPGETASENTEEESAAEEFSTEGVREEQPTGEEPTRSESEEPTTAGQETADPDETQAETRQEDLPSPIALLLDVTDSKVLREQIDEQVKKGTVTRGSSAGDFFMPDQCYIFVVEGNRVSAVLGPRTDGGRTNLQTGEEVENWSSRYSDNIQIWVDLVGN